MTSVALIIPIVGMSIPIILVPVIMGLKHARLDRELEHAERMKALEMGRTLPKDEPWWSPARISVAIGAGVPVCVFFCAWLASDPSGPDLAVWLSATVVGLAAVVSGSLLAHRHLGRIEGNHPRSVDPYAKPEIDADEFDVVGSRG